MVSVQRKVCSIMCNKWHCVRTCRIEWKVLQRGYCGQARKDRCPRPGKTVVQRGSSQRLPVPARASQIRLQRISNRGENRSSAIEDDLGRGMPPLKWVFCRAILYDAPCLCLGWWIPVKDHLLRDSLLISANWCWGTSWACLFICL